MKKRLKALDATLDEAYRELIYLSTLFIVHSMLLPLFFLWLLMRGLSWALVGNVKERLER